jgi:hypothetical protein
MFTNNDLTLMAIAVNAVLRKTQDAFLLVEKIDQAVNAVIALPEKQSAFYLVAAAWRRVARQSWIGKISGKPRQVGLKSTPAGTAGFEASKRKALDRANSWSVTQTGWTRPRGAALGIEPQRRGQPIEPMLTGREAQTCGENAASPAQEKAASTTASEDHQVREAAGTWK